MVKELYVRKDTVPVCLDVSMTITNVTNVGILNEATTHRYLTIIDKYDQIAYVYNQSYHCLRHSPESFTISHKMTLYDATVYGEF